MTQREPLEYFLQGNQKSKDIVVFLQGWPDNHFVWEPLDTPSTLKDSRVLYLNFPNTSKSQSQIKWGQDFSVIVQRMKLTFDKINLDSFEKKVVVAHDWGCIYFYAFDNTFPGQFNDIIVMDVPAYTEVAGITAKLMTLTYQWILATAFLIGGLPGKWFCQGVCKFFKHSPKYYDQLSGSRCYPYFYIWKNIFTSIFNKRKALLYRYIPSAPVVYLYGKKKPFQFGGQKWTTYLLEHQRCEIHGMDSGHWIMNQCSRFVTDLILRRLKEIRK